MEERLKQFMSQGTSLCESENRTKKQLAAHGDCSSIPDQPFELVLINKSRAVLVQ